MKAEPMLNCMGAVAPPEQMSEECIPVPGSIATFVSSAPVNTTFINDIMTREIESDDKIYPEKHLFVSYPAVIGQFSTLNAHDSLPHITVAIKGQQ